MKVIEEALVLWDLEVEGEEAWLEAGAERVTVHQTNLDVGRLVPETKSS